MGGNEGPKNLKLYADRSGAHAARCMIVAHLAEVSIEVVRDTAPAGGAPDERPLLLTRDGFVFSAYAIAKYLIALTAECGKKGIAAALLAPSGLPRYRAESWAQWALEELEPALSCSKEAMDHKFSFLESQLRKAASQSGDLTPPSIIEGVKKFCLADAFVIATLLRRADAISSRGPHVLLHGYLQAALQSEAVQAAFRAVPQAKPLDTLPTPDAASHERYYLTTAINYTNGPPHIGHAYEAITSDVIARYHRIFGRNVCFCTGTDEHGQKIAGAAETAGVSPQQLCDKYAEGFQTINSRMAISNDIFIRTTSEKHHEVCKWLWRRTASSGDIYLGKYIGWYNVREEAFVTEKDAELANYVDRDTGAPLQKMEEPSYFFRMSKYQTQLVDHIQMNQGFIQPTQRRNEILSRLKEPLEDLSISRTTFNWGVRVPDSEDKHVMYVWFDALTNYISAIGYPDDKKTEFWPADVHIIGKDILWFHTVIWPCMLLSAGVPLPKVVFGHGFVHAADGRKMSKSFGTAVDPNDVLDKYPTDSLRYFLVKESPYGADVKFDTDSFIDSHNADLADVLGNLVHRAIGLTGKYCKGRVPDCGGLPKGPAPFDFDRLASDTDINYKCFRLQEATDAAIGACKDTNKYLTDHAPWIMTDNVERQKVVRAILEATYMIAHFLEPILPTTADLIFKRLNTPRRTICNLSGWFDNMLPGTTVDATAPILFEKIAPRTAELPIQKCELRVGEVVSISAVRKATTVECLFEVVVRTAPAAVAGAADNQITAIICLKDSTLAAGTESTSLVGERVVVLCNVKVTNFKGVTCQGVIVAARAVQGSGLTVLTIPAEINAPLGTIVQVDGKPPILKARDNMTKQEYSQLQFEVRSGEVSVAGSKMQIGPGGPHLQLNVVDGQYSFFG